MTIGFSQLSVIRNAVKCLTVGLPIDAMQNNVTVAGGASFLFTRGVFGTRDDGLLMGMYVPEVDTQFTLAQKVNGAAKIESILMQPDPLATGQYNAELAPAHLLSKQCAQLLGQVEEVVKWVPLAVTVLTHVISVCAKANTGLTPRIAPRIFLDAGVPMQEGYRIWQSSFDMWKHPFLPSELRREHKGLAKLEPFLSSDWYVGTLTKMSSSVRMAVSGLKDAPLSLRQVQQLIRWSHNIVYKAVELGEVMRYQRSGIINSRHLRVPSDAHNTMAHNYQPPVLPPMVFVSFKTIGTSGQAFGPRLSRGQLLTEINNYNPEDIL